MEPAQWEKWLWDKCNALAEQAKAIWVNNPYTLHLVGDRTRTGRVENMRVVCDKHGEGSEVLEYICPVSPAWSFEQLPYLIREHLKRVPCLPLLTRWDASGKPIG